MMRANVNEGARGPTYRPPQVAVRFFGGRLALIILFLFLVLFLVSSPAWAGVDFDLVQVGGIPFTTVGGNYTSSFGTLNGLGIGTPTTGVTAGLLTTGTLYFTQYGLHPHGGLPAGHNGIITAYVSTNFSNPAALIMESCPISSTCTSPGQFSVMSTNVGAQTSVAPAPGIPKNATATAGLAIFVPDNNGATAFSGTDSAVITFTMTDSTNGTFIESITLSLNNPVETLQTAVQFTLGTATGGLTISPASDYSVNFGNVNGLGIAATLTTVSASGGIIYSTPYLLQPAFSDQTSTRATIQVALTGNFAHPTVLQLDDSASSTGPFTQITSTPLQITNTAADRSSISRYLGLFVSNTNNGPGSFTGSDTATLTYTMTVP